jgi:hypothetical protein
MALNLSLPATGITKHKDLYASLRANFSGINDKLTPTLRYLTVFSGITQYTPVRYYVDSLSNVYLFGLVQKLAGVSNICQLDSPYFPPSTLLWHFSYVTAAGGLTAPVAISPTGIVYLPYETNYTLTVYLDGIVFPTV